MNPLRRLHEVGQSVWLDYLRRGLITTGGLERLLREDAASGVTSNPTIFGRAIAGSTDYDEAIRLLADKAVRDPLEVFYDLALADIQMAADVFRPAYDETGGGDGFVSFELEPRLAYDTAGSVAAAHELVERIGKPNVMIKVPGTDEGVAAVEQLTASGVNVNITLLFSVATYERVAQAYLAGLERRLAAGAPLDRMASVASFFVSRVDTVVDGLLTEGSPLRGRVAIANAKWAYQRFRRLFSGERWERLAQAGARVQQPLWASTGTKNPAYSDVVYVEELIGPDTVNTMPEATMNAFRDHGRVRPLAIVEELEEAEATLALLPEHGIDLEAVAAALLKDGLAAFETDLTKLLAAIQAKLEVAGARLERATGLGDRGARGRLPDTLEAKVARRLDEAARNDLVGRIWSKGHTVWKPEPTEITDRLGWLDLPDTEPGRVDELRAFAKQARADGFTQAVLLGMGGSSLAAAVARRILGVAPDAMDLQVLDTTHPSAIATLEQGLDLQHTLFVVASKSGGTIETLSHFAYFFTKIGCGEQFVAITDPGTPLEALARSRNFRAVFLNPFDVGGRYSALSVFGLLPAALFGAGLEGMLDAGAEMACACHRCVPCSENPGLWLGAVMGEAVRAGRDKLTLVLPLELAPLGPWVEQLLAESTGKEGTGIVPVIDEDLAAPDRYGTDRLFVALGDHEALSALEAAGHPVARLDANEPGRLGGEFFRWEFATAVAGHVLGVNPFDQPNVAEVKEATRRILESRVDDPGFDDLQGSLQAVHPGDYIALQAFCDPTAAITQRLQQARLGLRDRHRVATTLGFGPRFLHSTGQLHKGGPPSGVFIQIVDDARDVDLPIPGRPFTFGSLLDAAALADLLSLRRRDRRVARVTLSQLEEAVF